MRWLAAVRTDVVLQARNQLYGISVGVAALCAGGLAWLAAPEHFAAAIPMVVLMFVGGSTLLYVVAMIILERDDELNEGDRGQPEILERRVSVERGEKIGGVSGDLAEQSEYLFLVFFCHNSSRISLPKLSVTISILRNSHPPSSASGSPVS